MSDCFMCNKKVRDNQLKECCICDNSVCKNCRKICKNCDEVFCNMCYEKCENCNSHIHTYGFCKCKSRCRNCRTKINGFEDSFSCCMECNFLYCDMCGESCVICHKLECCCVCTNKDKSQPYVISLLNCKKLEKLFPFGI